MAVSQLSNSASVNQLPPHPTFQHLRIQAGVITVRRAPTHLGWRLVAAYVRWYRTLSPESRALLRALFIAMGIAALLIRLIIIVAQ